MRNFMLTLVAALSISLSSCKKEAVSNVHNHKELEWVAEDLRAEILFRITDYQNLAMEYLDFSILAKDAELNDQPETAKANRATLDQIKEKVEVLTKEAADDEIGQLRDWIKTVDDKLGN